MGQDTSLPFEHHKLGGGHLFCFLLVLLHRYMCVFALGFSFDISSADVIFLSLFSKYQGCKIWLKA